MQSFLSRWAPVVGWAAVIFLLSAVPSLESGLSLTWDVILRKIAHATEFAILTFLLLRAFGRPMPLRMVFALALGVLYAASDEIHQAFVPGREPAGLDVLIDAVGAFAGVLIRSRYFGKENQTLLRSGYGG